MIIADDTEFHSVPSNVHESWAETNYFPFSIAEEGIAGAVYNVFRPGLGVCLSDVTLFDRCANHWEGLAYSDNQQHIVCPASLSHYQLRNGVAVKVINPPHDYQVSYQGIDETAFHLSYTGLMRPQDLNDPQQGPLTRKNQVSSGGWDDAFKGHFDMTAHVTGELILRGKHYPVDCIATIDHSWGPRVERDNSSAVVIQAYFDKDIAVHVLAAFNPGSEQSIGPAYHGYVLRDGVVLDVVAVQGQVCRKGLFPVSMEVVVEDEGGNIYRLSGQMLNWAPWAPYTSVMYYAGLAEWRMGDRRGYGPYQEILSRAFVARHKLSD